MTNRTGSLRRAVLALAFLLGVWKLITSATADEPPSTPAPAFGQTKVWSIHLELSAD